MKIRIPSEIRISRERIKEVTSEKATRIYLLIMIILSPVFAACVQDSFEDGDYTNAPTWTVVGHTWGINSTIYHGGSKSLQVLESDTASVINTSVSSCNNYSVWVYVQPTTNGNQIALQASGVDKAIIQVDTLAGQYFMYKDAGWGNLAGAGCTGSPATNAWYLFQINYTNGGTYISFRVSNATISCVEESTIVATTINGFKLNFRQIWAKADTLGYIDDASATDDYGNKSATTITDNTNLHLFPWNSTQSVNISASNTTYSYITGQALNMTCLGAFNSTGGAVFMQNVTAGTPINIRFANTTSYTTDCIIQNFYNASTTTTATFQTHRIIDIYDNSTSHLTLWNTNNALNFTGMYENGSYAYGQWDNVTVVNGTAFLNRQLGLATDTLFGNSSSWNNSVLVNWSRFGLYVNHTYYFYTVNSNISFSVNSTLAGSDYTFSNFTRNDWVTQPYSYTPFIYWNDSASGITIAGSNPYTATKTMPDITGSNVSVSVTAGLNISYAGVIYNLTTSATQIIYHINISNANCDPNYGWHYFLNLSLYDEINTSAQMTDLMANYTGEVRINFDIDSLGYHTNFTDLNVTETHYCIYPNDTSITTPSIVSIEYGAGGWATRNYHLCNFYINASTNTLRNIYLLKNSAPANLQSWIIKDVYNNPNEGYYLDVMRYYPGDPLGYRDVFIGKSAADGTINQYLEYGAYYKSLIYDKSCNLVWYETSPSQYYGTARTIYTSQLDNTFWQDTSGILYNGTYSSVTGLYSMIVTDKLSGTLTSATLHAYEKNVLYDWEECNSTYSGTSSFNTACVVSDTTKDHIFTVTTCYTDGRCAVTYTELIHGTNYDINTYDYGLNGVFITVIFCIGAIGIGLMFQSGVISILLLYMALMLSSAMNWIIFDDMSKVIITIISLLIIWWVGRRW